METKTSQLKEAMFYQKTGVGEVLCNLCSHHCRIQDTQRGLCGVRENRRGVLYSLIHRKLVSRAVDPIEKKPLFHFLPASSSFSVATVGCNFRCLHCQNANIAHMPHDLKRIVGEDVSPDEIVAEAVSAGCQSISYTYTEPTIFFEYAYETALLAHARGLRNVFVSNGYMTEEVTQLIAPYLDAINIDLKGLEPFYKKVCAAHLQPVVNTIRKMHELGVWVEVTTLIIPTLNDEPDQIRRLADIVASIDPSIPWHLSAFHPAYRLLDKPPTTAESIYQAIDIGTQAGLRHVYVGNLPGARGENTYCYQCGQLLLERIGHTITQNYLSEGHCTYCQAEIAGVWV